MMSLGEKIAQLRKQKDWTQDDFAEKVGVHGRHISRWESDKTKPRLKRLQKIAEVFGVPLDELLPENGTGVAAQDSKYLREFGELKEDDKDIIGKMVHALATRRRMEKLLHSEE